MGADSFLHITFIGGLTDVVGVMGRFGDDVVTLELFWLVDKLVLVVVSDFDVVALDDEDLRLDDDMDVLDADDDLLDIWVFVCCCSCCLHFALRFLNQTW